MRRFLSSLALLLTCPAALGQGAVWTVSSDPCANADFDEISLAIAAAGEGDVVLVAPAAGAYADFAVDGRSVSVLSSGGPVDVGAVEVKNLGASQSVLLRGLRTADRMELTGNDGLVWLEDSIVDTPNFLAFSSVALAVEDCASVALVRCTLTSANAALSATASEVHAYATELVGMDGEDGVSIAPGLFTDGQKGGDGAVLADSFLFAGGCTVRGGHGGDAAETASCASVGGAGGSGLVLDALASTTMLDNEIAAGSGGLHSCAGSAPDGVPIAGTGGLFPIEGLAAGEIDATPLVSEGELLETMIRGTASDLVFLAFGLGQESDHQGVLNGTLLVDPFTALFLGPMPGAGELPFGAFVPPGLVPAGTALELYLQPAFVNAGGEFFLGTPAVPLLVDAAYVGC